MIVDLPLPERPTRAIVDPANANTTDCGEVRASNTCFTSAKNEGSLAERHASQFTQANLRAEISREKSCSTRTSGRAG